ncbi:ribosome recycling factor family protein [Shewanella sp. Isolate8]|uniref:ribosome recycling factor family protein n=1 Tax=Shewanella sp. Isolate8 TaxID=2908529 RepID=UPI001EFCDA1C|nr:ribosome recycling factor family protein [Shewanella sp. Isolate8]MCG9747553.1 ribosome recycling factor family protein [Shewanella sp. Isolate8]
MNEAIVIALPSLIHRIGREKVTQAQTLAEDFGCSLKRVRRSRNWQLVGGAVDVQSFTQALKQCQPAMAPYLITKLEAGLLPHADKLEPLEVKLVRMIRETPGITLGELMEQTQCTIIEARQARFEADS